VIVGTPHVERICALEAEHDAILVVDTYPVNAAEVARERVQTIPGRYFRVIEPSHRIDLIQFPAHDWPQLARNAPSRLAVDAVPDVARGVIRQRPNHCIAL
jgi:hypothetical protein